MTVIENIKIIFKYCTELNITCLYDKSYWNFSKITKFYFRGNCLNCNLNLRQIEITNEEFNDLASAVLKNLMIGKNVYCSTSPQELKRYMTFVQTMKKYDVVVDGLNVAYCNKDVGEKRASIKNVNNFDSYI